MNQCNTQKNKRRPREVGRGPLGTESTRASHPQISEKKRMICATKSQRKIVTDPRNKFRRITMIILNRRKRKPRDQKVTQNQTKSNRGEEDD